MRKILKSLEKISKNNVSYFEAGYIAGLLKSKIITPTQIIDLHYCTCNFRIKCLNIYRNMIKKNIMSSH